MDKEIEVDAYNIRLSEVVLDKAIKEENHELAAWLRDELQRQK